MVHVNLVNMTMVNLSRGKCEHGKSESCEVYHVKCDKWKDEAAAPIVPLMSV